MAPRPTLTRLIDRPLLSDWKEDELITLAEAEALLFPNGPLNVSSLRRCHKSGSLEVVVICGKAFTSIVAVRSLIATSAEQSKKTSINEHIADAQKMMVEKFKATLKSTHKHKKGYDT